MGREEKNPKIHAPYNFVPFSGKIIERYKDMEELPDYGKIDPDLKTGEIHVTMETHLMPSSSAVSLTCFPMIK